MSRRPGGHRQPVCFDERLRPWGGQPGRFAAARLGTARGPIKPRKGGAIAPGPASSGSAKAASSRRCRDSTWASFDVKEPQMPRCVPAGSRAARSKRLLRRGERLTSAALLRLPKLPPPVYKLLGRMGCQ